MAKKGLIIIILAVMFFSLNTRLVCAQGEAIEDARKKATEIHNLASSDVIYSDEELKALYYQNIQIIGLLREIRTLLRKQVELLQDEE